VAVGPRDRALESPLERYLRLKAELDQLHDDVDALTAAVRMMIEQERMYDASSIAESGDVRIRTRLRPH
jgi:hypothetical protein